jgi:hypothetical protein
MGYIARTDGGLTVLELRQSTLAEIAEAERSAWRTVNETRPNIDAIRQVYSAAELEVSGDGAQVHLTWQVAELPAQMVKMRLKQYAASLRWRKQQEPLMLPNGVVIDATEASKAKIQQALTVLEKGWASSLDFKAVNGWVTVDLAGLTAVAQALVSREQAMFTAEKDVAAAIDAGTVTTVAAIDGWAWP